MKRDSNSRFKIIFGGWHFWLAVFVSVFFIAFFTYPEFFSSAFTYKQGETISNIVTKIITPTVPPLDLALYDQKIELLANNPPPKPPTTKVVKDPKTGEEKIITVPAPIVHNLWPVKTFYPKDGAILPFKRVVAYYGNLLSTKMGVLGEYPEAIMLAKLEAEVAKWEMADPETPVVPALHYIAVVAQGSPGADGKYRARMSGTEIEKVLKIANKINAIVFLDVQVGFSTVEAEIPLLDKYLKLPNVHLGIDPEFSMKTGIRPGKVVGTYDATDINFVVGHLSKIVQENNLTPKILVIHRYTEKMVTNSKLIKTLPEVQIVMNMDGWGTKAKKLGIYNNFIYPQPVQFAGFKLFYKNDILTPGTVLMTPEDVLKLRPKPIYIQYQ